jgi:hypothetical protein
MRYLLKSLYRNDMMQKELMRLIASTVCVVIRAA